MRAARHVCSPAGRAAKLRAAVVAANQQHTPREGKLSRCFVAPGSNASKYGDASQWAAIVERYLEAKRTLKLVHVTTC